MEWSPKTLEDDLISKYHYSCYGTLYLEVPITLSNKIENARYVDAILINDTFFRVYVPKTYSVESLISYIRDKKITVIEAKEKLNRNVVGQILVAKYLIEQVMSPSTIEMLIVTKLDNPDIRSFCMENGISVKIFPEGTKGKKGQKEKNVEPSDIRQYPNSNHLRAFLTGWSKAVEGKLYKSIRDRKTHANMGNLFGWIYGDVSKEFRIKTWERYIQNTKGVK